MRDSDLPVLAIAAQISAKPSTIRTWNRRFGRHPLSPSLAPATDP